MLRTLDSSTGQRALRHRRRSTSRARLDIDGYDHERRALCLEATFE